jgi:hypothetical protein
MIGLKVMIGFRNMTKLKIQIGLEVVIGLKVITDFRNMTELKIRTAFKNVIELKIPIGLEVVIGSKIATEIEVKAKLKTVTGFKNVKIPKMFRKTINNLPQKNCRKTDKNPGNVNRFKNDQRKISKITGRTKRQMFTRLTARQRILNKP